MGIEWSWRKLLGLGPSGAEIAALAIKSIKETSMAQAEATRAMGEALGEWVKSFQTDRVPESFVLRPEDELKFQQERDMEQLIAAGFPVGGTPEQQLKWMDNLMMEPLK